MTKTNESVLKEYAITNLKNKRGATEIQILLMEKFGCTKTEAGNAIVKAKAERAKEKAEKNYEFVNPEKNSCQCGERCECDSNEESEFDLTKRYNTEGDLLWAKEQLKKANKEIAYLKKNLGSKNHIVDSLRSETPFIKPLPFDIVPFKKDKKSVSAVIQYSDWHMGERVKGQEVENYFNEFNYAICKERVKTFTQKFISWARLHQHNYNIDEVVVLCTGDFVAGDIHLELQIGNESAVTSQARYAGELLADSVSTIAPLFKKVRVEFVTLDNHGRNTTKNQHKGGGENNNNYHVGHYAKIHLEKHSNVEFNIHVCAKQVVKVQNRKYLVEHGCGIKSVMGIPFYGIERYIGRECQARKNTDLQFDMLVLGHFHQPMVTSKYIMSGSLVGDSEFGRSFGGHEWACQTCWLVHETHAEFDYINFWLNGPNA